MKIIKKKYINELLFTVYLYLFSLLKILTTNFTNISTIILFSATITILIISLYYNKIKISNKFIILLFISIFIIFFEIIIRYNNQTFAYIYDYIIYGLITIFLYSHVKNKEVILKYYVNLSALTFFILFLDPINNYRMTETYMVYGYSMLPVFAGLYLGWIYFNKKWTIPFVIISFIQLGIFANRGAILTAIIIAIILYLNKLSKKKHSLSFIIKKSSLFLFASLFILVIFNNSYKLINYLYEFLSDKGYFSYALYTLRRTISTGDVSFELSTREVIQDSAREFIGNNFLLGSGVGSFQDYYGIYSHNLILDILTTFGVIGLILFIILFIKSAKRILTSNGFDRVFGLLIILLTIIPLWFSMNFFVSNEFWVLLMIGFDSNNNSKYLKYSKESKNR